MANAPAQAFLKMETPIGARFGTTVVLIVRIGFNGCRLEHSSPLRVYDESDLRFVFQDAQVALRTLVTKSRMECLAGGVPLYSTDLQFSRLSRPDWKIVGAIIDSLSAEL